MLGLALTLLCATDAGVSEEPAWETVATGAITVKARPRAGTEVFEIWAEADLDAPVQDLQATLTTVDKFSSFMPYVKSAKFVSASDDGASFNYTELGLPIISDRDYVVKTWLDESVAEDGSGIYRTHWVSAHDKLPEKSGIIRVKVNEGSWVVAPLPGDANKSHVIYKFAADPGGMLPTWAKNIGNRRGVSGTLEAIEKEAQRRKKERAAAAK